MAAHEYLHPQHPFLLKSPQQFAPAKQKQFALLQVKPKVLISKDLHLLPPLVFPLGRTA